VPAQSHRRGAGARLASAARARCRGGGRPPNPLARARHARRVATAAGGAAAARLPGTRAGGPVCPNTRARSHLGREAVAADEHGQPEPLCARKTRGARRVSGGARAAGERRRVSPSGGGAVAPFGGKRVRDLASKARRLCRRAARAHRCGGRSSPSRASPPAARPRARSRSCGQRGGVTHWGNTQGSAAASSAPQKTIRVSKNR
jgi:hypothetical protein